MGEMEERLGLRVASRKEPSSSKKSTGVLQAKTTHTCYTAGIPYMVTLTLPAPMPGR